jgi:UDP-N-acetylmuramoyl-tripeptide--D-alanyl-D-alanine ligase
MGTLEGVFQEKSVLVHAAPPTGLVVLGDDHAFVDRLEQLSVAPVVKVSGRGVQLSRNIARAIGSHLGLSDKEIEAGIAAFTPLKARLEKFSAAGMTVIDDTYNANPISMKLALDELTQLAEPAQRRVAVLGAMAELGDAAARYHMEIGDYARKRCDILIGVGDLARHYAASHWFADSGAAAQNLSKLLRPSDRVLIKGSKSVGMNVISERLRATSTLTGEAPGASRSGDALAAELAPDLVHAVDSEFSLRTPLNMAASRVSRRAGAEVSRDQPGPTTWA